jgi:hypothetical protein
MMPQSLKTIDLLKESLSKNYRSKKARTVKQAYDALMGKKPGEARTLVASLRSDPLYQDYAFWISAAAHRLDAERALDGKKPDGRRALTHTEKALTDTLEISTRQPYSPFLKTLERDTALGELLAADANLELGKKKSARESFERAFQRLSNQGAMSRLRPDHLARYAETCVGKA